MRDLKLVAFFEDEDSCRAIGLVKDMVYTLHVGGKLTLYNLTISANGVRCRDDKGYSGYSYLGDFIPLTDEIIGYRLKTLYPGSPKTIGYTLNSYNPNTKFWHTKKRGGYKLHEDELADQKYWIPLYLPDTRLFFKKQLTLTHSEVTLYSTGAVCFLLPNGEKRYFRFYSLPSIFYNSSTVQDTFSNIITREIQNVKLGNLFLSKSDVDLCIETFNAMVKNIII